jgi:hypothetical protein
LSGALFPHLPAQELVAAAFHPATSPNLHFASQFRIAFVRQADCQSTLRGIDKPLHSFDVHLPLYLRCLNGSLGLFHSSLSRSPRKSSPVSTFDSCLQLKRQLHPVDSSFDQSVARSIRWPLRRYNWCNSTRSFSRALSFSPLRAPPARSLHLLLPPQKPARSTPTNLPRPS